MMNSYKDLLKNITLGSNRCWNWKLSTHQGYGNIWWIDKRTSAHRASYICFVGEIPKGYDLHHKCGNRLCINPVHLELKTHGNHTEITNNNRKYAKRTICNKGHKLEGNNIIVDKQGNRRCRACRNSYMRDYRI